MIKVHLDFETRSRVDIRSCGAYRYAQDPSTEVLCASYAINKEAPKTLRFAYGYEAFVDVDELKALAENPEVIFFAFNANFERNIWKEKFVHFIGVDIPLERWHCVAAIAAAHGLPKSLEECSLAVGIEGGKDKEGRAAMLKLCSPGKDGKFIEDSELYEKLCRYCPKDVELEREIKERTFDLPESEWETWRLDQRINDYGIAIDLVTVSRALKVIDHATQIRTKQLSNLTNGVLTDVGLPKIKKYLKEKGYNFESLAKDKLKEAIAASQSDTEFILKMREELGQTSLAKYGALMQATCLDGRLRGALFYHSAFTGRWGGRLVQPQNLPRGTIKNADSFIDFLDVENYTLLEDITGHSIFDVLSSMIRGMFWAGEGKELIIADFAAIEARVLFWLANEPGLKLFWDYDEGRTDVDIYVRTVRTIYQDPHITKADKDKRQLGKMCILGCGYQMGPGTFQMQAKAQWGVDLDAALAERIVNTYRRTYKKVVEYWYALQNAAIKAIQGTPTGGFRIEGQFLTYKLPSGRKLYYFHPEIKDGSIRYWSNDSASKKLVKKETYGGKLAENITQAVARDLMVHSMKTIEAAGGRTVLTVHDEIVSEKFMDEKEFEKLMCQKPDWAKGIPLAAEAEVTRRYKK